MDKKEQIEKAAKQWANYAYCPMTPNKDSDYIIAVAANGFIEGYNNALSQPKEVDLDELREEFKKRFFTPHTPTEIERGMTLVFDWCIEHLQKPVESDAVEFAGWIRNEINEDRLRHYDPTENGLWSYWKIGGGAIASVFTTKELYKQFKQLKK